MSTRFNLKRTLKLTSLASACLALAAACWVYPSVSGLVARILGTILFCIFLSLLLYFAPWDPVVRIFTYLRFSHLRRYSIRTLFVAVALFAFVCTFLAPSTETVTSTVAIPLLPPDAGQTLEFYESQIQLLKSPFVLSAALRGMESPVISRQLRVKPSQLRTQDFVAWCDEHVECTLNEDKTCIVFTLSSPRASKSQLSELAKRIADAYREEAHCSQRVGWDIRGNV